MLPFQSHRQCDKVPRAVLLAREQNRTCHPSTDKQDAEKSRPGWEIPSQSLQITPLIFKFRKTIKQNLFYKCYSDIKNSWIKYHLQNRILLTNRLHSRRTCAYLT